MIDIGTRRELFVDRFLIETLNGVRQVMHRPRREEKALVFDKPWEGGFSGYPTVLKDGKRYLLYYRGAPAPPASAERRTYRPWPESPCACVLS